MKAVTTPHQQISTGLIFNGSNQLLTETRNEGSEDSTPGAVQISTGLMFNGYNRLLSETRNEGDEDTTPAAVQISTGLMFNRYNQQQSGELSTILTPLSRAVSGQGQIRVRDYTTPDESHCGGGNLTVYFYPDGSDIARPYTGYASSSSWSGRQKRRRDAEQHFIQFADQQQFQGTYFTDSEDFTTNAPEKATGIAPTNLGNPQYRTMEAAEETGGKGKGYKGVRQLQWGKWGAEIIDPQKGSVIWIGTYDTAEEAATAYDNAALELIGDRAQLNFPVALAPSLQVVGNLTVAAPPQVQPPPQLPISNSPAIRYSMTPPPQPTLQLPISSSPTIRNSRTPPQLPISNSPTICNSRTPQPLQPPRQLQNFSTPTIRNPRTPPPQPPPQLPIYNPPSIRNSRTPQPLQPPRQLQNFNTPTICNPRTPPPQPPPQLPNYNAPTIRNSRTPQPLQPPRQLQHFSSPTIPYPIIPTPRPPPQLPVYPTTPPPRPSTQVLISNSPITPQPRPPTQMLISSSPTCHDAITPRPRPLQLQPTPQMAICSSPRTFVPITPQLVPPQLQLPLSAPSSNSPTIFSSMTPQPPQFHQTQQEQQISQHYPGCSEYYPLFLDDTDDFPLQELSDYWEYNPRLLEDTNDSLVLERPDYLEGMLYDDSTLPAGHSQPPVSSFSVPSSSSSRPQQFSNQQNVHLSFPNTQNQGDGSNVQGFPWDTSHNFPPFSG